MACRGQTMPVVMLSDLHFDPLRDPAKAERLAAAPTSQWPGILREPATPTQAADFAAMQARCGSKNGLDSDYALLSSALHAASAQAAGVGFVTVSGDLVVHQFECRWKQATGHSKGYEDFHEKTAEFVIRQVEAVFPGVPVYLALGNNDSSCGDYRMDLHDRYFQATSGAVLAGLVGASKAERVQAERDYLAGGYFSVALPGLAKTRLLVVDDIYLSRKYQTCAGKQDRSEGEAVLQWLGGQLDEARRRGEAVWVLAHIPPGVDVYNTVAKQRNVCGGDAPESFLADDAFGTLIAKSQETVRLTLLGHTHSDEVRLLGDVPAKLVGSVTPVNGNLPTFTVGQVNRRTSALADYAVYMAADKAGAGPWLKEYDFDQTFGAEAFSTAVLRAQIAEFRKDPDSNDAASKAYEQDFFPGSPSPLVLVWPQAVCALGDFSAAAYRSCACKP